MLAPTRPLVSFSAQQLFKKILGALSFENTAGSLEVLVQVVLWEHTVQELPLGTSARLDTIEVSLTNDLHSRCLPPLQREESHSMVPCLKFLTLFFFGSFCNPPHFCVQRTVFPLSYFRVKIRCSLAHRKLSITCSASIQPTPRQ